MRSGRKVTGKIERPDILTGQVPVSPQEDDDEQHIERGSE